MNRESLLEKLKSQLGNVSVAVEVGVWRGDYSRFIISSLEPSTFIGVDPYKIYEGYTDKPDEYEFANQKNLDVLFGKVSKAFQGFNKDSVTPIYRKIQPTFPYKEVVVESDLTQTNSILVRQIGANYASQFEDNSVDFVYLDADHKYQPVKSEIEAWYPKVRKGGILAGHDYITGSHIEEFGVITAVNEFIKREQLKLNTTTEEYPSWWVTKT